MDARSLEEQRTGIGRYLINLLREWGRIAAGDTFHLYYLKDEPCDPCLEAPCFRKTRLTLALPFSKAPFFPELERNPVDVFFSPLYDLPPLETLPAVITVHDMVYEAYPESFSEIQLQYLRSTSARSIPYAARIITDSDFSRREILTCFPGVSGKIEVIPLAADPFFSELPRKEQALGELRKHYPLRDPFFFYVGSISRKRHIPSLIREFREFLSSHEAFQLFLAGKNLIPGMALEEMVQDSNLGRAVPAVIHEPYLPEDSLLGLYNNCLALVYLSEYEGFGMPPLEAMACGAPVITTNLSSLSEVVGEAALIVDPRNPGEIRAALERIAVDEGLRRELAAAGKTRCGLFSWEETASMTLKVLRSAARK